MRFIFSVFLCLLSLTSCVRTTNPPEALTSLNLVDQNGLTQTIGSKERLKNFASVDFQKPQPYQKVLRVYTPRQDGSIPAIVTSYYPSGQIKQSLSILSGRAFGPYLEWYENGSLKIEASLVGGSPQLGVMAERSWIFQGPCKAYNEKGKLVGSMVYDRGVLIGESLYWTDEGRLSKKLFYEKGQLTGVAEYYYPENGALQQKISYVAGLRHGPLAYYRTDGVCLSEEYYEAGKLQTASYAYCPQPAGVEKGEGVRFVEEDKGYRLEEIRGGEIEGEIKEYEKDLLVHSFHQRKGLKEGKECFWSPSGIALIEISYRAGKIQGEIITRYEKGSIQSRREMSNNQKNGTLRTWYLDGQIMMVEEYAQDKLVSGSYYKKGSGFPVSTISNGEGTATIFDEVGQLDRKISYKDGKPY